MTGKCIISFDCESKWGMADNLSEMHDEMLSEDKLIKIYKELVRLLDAYNMPATFGFVAALTMEPKLFLEKWGDDLRESPDHSKWLKRFFDDVDSNNLSGWFCPELLNIVSRSPSGHDICSHGFTHLAWKAASPEAIGIETKGIHEWYELNNITPKTFIFPRNQVGNRNFLSKIQANAYRDQPKYLSSLSLFSRLKALISEFNLYPKSQHHNFYKIYTAIPGGFFLNWRSGFRKFIPVSLSVMRFKNALNHAAKNNGTINLWSHPHNFITGKNQFQLFKKCLDVLKEQVNSGKIEIITQEDYFQEIDKVNKIIDSKIETTSVVIPVSGGSDFIKDLINALKNQTYAPTEIIFIISKVENYEKTMSILESEKELNIFFKVIEASYPGKARNIGAKFADSKWLAFLDLRTIPSPKWLEEMIRTALINDTKFVGAKMICSADSAFKKYLKAVTFGNTSARSLPGSIVLNKSFQKNSGFLDHVRAGEDWEWIKRINNRMPSSWVSQVVISYSGLPVNLKNTVKKWLRYSIENSKVNILIKEKFFYVALFFVFFAIFLYRWNHIVSGDTWDVNNPLFIPNLNKIFWSIFLASYLIFRGFINPIFHKVTISFLLPYRWILVGALGAILDIIKAPGRILGFFSYLKSKK